MHFLKLFSKIIAFFKNYGRLDIEESIVIGGRNKMNEKLQSVIKYLIDESEVTDITPKKLQKLLYYCFAWHLALTAEDNSSDELNSSRLFEATFEAWAHGPVIPEVYDKYKNYKATVIPTSGLKLNTTDYLNEDELDSIKQVIEVYGNFNGNQLEFLTHNEDPWKKARKGYAPLDICKEKIDITNMYEFYSSQLV
ncbi:Panacea domain-containing protein [Streptococcus mutans]|uniref:Panacea domain-containing protein n=1 Tax=Streptococcus mutans TaxID=1309 RepID=UPI0002B5BA5C|nr:type II toxin-antitoxin system antitoxin SocA domain-containing protein [Streptococcus mutans]EMB55798.1 putative phage-associated protein [Streptococcus mutans 1ID3]